ncbi:MAG: phospho-N-acetylmuramoyl-pentapeptide-transferase, partial [Promicromonosporaceae bacterium]|nr:phospho-N-acetylmuramoyl-pentapeptide-transferase [Promicromonosporaceae bacterium]
MIALLLSAAVALLVSLLGTPLLIRYLVRQQYGQFIRQDGPTAHLVKRGTPTMGGVVIIIATVAGVLAAAAQRGRPPSATIWLTLLLMGGLGFIGFLDDFTKIRNQRSLGLTPMAKIIGQAVVGIAFALLAVHFPNANGRTPASFRISVLRDTNWNMRAWGLVIGLILFVIWANFLITAWSNAVNLTDGLDGLATGVSLV